MNKFIIRYIIAVVVMLILLKFEVFTPLSDLLCIWLANSAAWGIKFFDAELIQTGTILRHGLHGVAIDVTPECNALEATLLLFIAIITFPSQLKYKIYGLIVGLCALQGLNVIRLMSLYHVLDAHPLWFDWIHEYLWRGLILLDMMLIFAAWIFFTVRKQTPLNHAH